MATGQTEFRFGIWERLAVAAFLAGVAGVVAGMTLPAAYQEALAHSGLGPILFWSSIAIISLSVLFFVCDLVLYLLQKMGIGVGAALATIGTALIVIGAVVGLVGAFKMDVSRSSQTVTANFPKLEDFFAKDFNLLSLNQTFSIRTQNPANGLDSTVDVQFRLFQDFSTNTEFVAVFVPFFSDSRLSQMTVPFLDHLKDGVIGRRACG